MTSKLFAILLPFILSNTCSAASGSRPEKDVIIRAIETSAIVGFSWVDQPIGRIVLVRTATTICGIRFSEFFRDKLPHPASTFKSGGYYEYANYEILELDLNNVPISLLRKGQVSYEGMVGIGHLSNQRGKYFVSCGGQKIYWQFPTALFMTFGERSQKFDISPTAWVDFSNVDVKSPKLKWYGWDSSESRPYSLISIKDLPGAEGSAPAGQPNTNKQPD